MEVCMNRAPALPPAVLVTGGKGGVGKSTVAAGLARALTAAGHRVGLLDADLSGPSQSVLFGMDRVVFAANKMVPPVVDGIAVASMGAIAEASTPLLWNRHTVRGTVLQLLEDVDWVEQDLLVVDVPPGASDVHTFIAETLLRSAWLVVTVGSPVALADCDRCIELLLRMEAKVLGLIANMTHHHCANCGDVQHLFSPRTCEELAARRGLELLARLPFDQEVVQGKGLASVAGACATWARDVNA
jgi:ATP-binding protein involved in chromosome partitioning